MLSIYDFLIKTEYKCEVHGCFKYRTLDTEPFCVECEEEYGEVLNDLDGYMKIMPPYNMDYFLRYDQFFRKSLFADVTIKEASFSNFDITSEAEQKVYNVAVDRTARIMKGEKFNLIFTGNAGVGKSHLAMAMAKEINEQQLPALKKKVLFASVNDILSEIRHSFDDNRSKYDEYTMHQLLNEADVLVLDDLGSETGAINTNKKASDFTQRVLYNLLNARQGKNTIITTNYSGTKLRQVYDQKLLSRMLFNAKGNIIPFNNISDKRFEALSVLN